MEISDTARRFADEGFAAVGEVIPPVDLGAYREIYDRLLSGEIESGDKRSDLGSHIPRKEGVRENITQIMWPSALYPPLLDLPLHQKALSVARELIGADAELDFDMMIHKAPYADAATPWHQDAAYWVDMPDHRAVSLWVALDDADVDNGCMWYVQGSHRQPLRPHRPTSDGKNIECDCSEDEPGAMPVPLRAGEAVAHSGFTLHSSRGNTTGGTRRAYILNFRPAAMIQLERERGADHGLVVAGLTLQDPDPDVLRAVMDSLGPGGLCEDYTGTELLAMIPQVRELAVTAFESGREARRRQAESPSVVIDAHPGVVVTGGSPAHGEELAALLTDVGRDAVYAERLGPEPGQHVSAVIHLGDPHGEVYPLPDMLRDAEKIGAQRLIHVSSAAVHRGTEVGECLEDAPSTPPHDAQARAWWDGEQACRRWSSETGIPLQIVRLAEQVGPHSPLRGVLATWMLQAWTRQPMIVVNGRQRQIVVHHDVAQALAAVLAGPVRASTYNVASAQYSETELAELAAETARRTPWERAADPCSSHTPLMSTDLITAETGWQPSASVRSAARAQAQWLACDTHDRVLGSAANVLRANADA